VGGRSIPVALSEVALHNVSQTLFWHSPSHTKDYPTANFERPAFSNHRSRRTVPADLRPHARVACEEARFAPACSPTSAVRRAAACRADSAAPLAAEAAVRAASVEASARCCDTAPRQDPQVQRTNRSDRRKSPRKPHRDKATGHPCPFSSYQCRLLSCSSVRFIPSNMPSHSQSSTHGEELSS
jgi:hypothetical protein